MTHKDIYIKFMIEYDKANVTSSYPSLTEYEVATVLDKAYNALIALKVTGNNYRRSTFESDIKAIADLQPLIKSVLISEQSLIETQTDQYTDVVTTGTGTVGEKHYGANNSGEISYVLLDALITPIAADQTKDYVLYNSSAASGNLYISDPTNANTMVIDKAITLPYTLTSEDKAAIAAFSSENEGSHGSIGGIYIYSTIIQNGGKFAGTTCTLKEHTVVTTQTSVTSASTNTFDDLTDTSNSHIYDLSDVEDFLYFLQCYVAKQNKQIDANGDLSAALSYLYKDEDEKNTNNTTEIFVLPVKLLNHELSNSFHTTAHNIPWVKDPICYLEDNQLVVVYDPIDKPETDKIRLLYIKRPNLFVKSDTELASVVTANGAGTDAGLFSVTKNNTDLTGTVNRYQFELNDTMAEELVSLAIAFALENVESPRLNSRLNMRGLEA